MQYKLIVQNYIYKGLRKIPNRAKEIDKDRQVIVELIFENVRVLRNKNEGNSSSTWQL